MEISFNTSLSGIQTSLTRHEVAANDIANINTRGYQEQRVIQAENYPMGATIASISSTQNSPMQDSNTDLAEETGEIISGKHGVAANSKAIKIKDRMLGEILDLMG